MTAEHLKLALAVLLPTLVTGTTVLGVALYYRCRYGDPIVAQLRHSAAVRVLVWFWLVVQLGVGAFAWSWADSYSFFRPVQGRVGWGVDVYGRGGAKTKLTIHTDKGAEKFQFSQHVSRDCVSGMMLSKPPNTLKFQCGGIPHNKSDCGGIWGVSALGSFFLFSLYTRGSFY